tara:strand:- start:711 stop:1445 length:735 start_codon:yes stop_codon:yes gene_type:complete
MKILSWDIGIKNLSYCFLEKKDNDILIKDWNIINLEDEIPVSICNAKCKNGNNCSSKSVFFSKDKKIGYCRTHYKKLENLKDYKEKKKVKKKKEDLINIGSKLINELNNRFDNTLELDNVLLENQPSLKNPTMKSIQMIIYSYFLINGYTIEPKYIKHIQMISATQKNKFCNEYCKTNDTIEKPKTKSSYNNAKKLAILVTQDILEKKQFNNINPSDYIDFFKENKKKDDLADSYLQGLQYLLK